MVFYTLLIYQLLDIKHLKLSIKKSCLNSKLELLLYGKGNYSCKYSNKLYKIEYYLSNFKRNFRLINIGKINNYR